ncbi:MAG: YicC/YloC family endoribonuclease, partial [Hyphomicrobiaceae bacterium]
MAISSMTGFARTEGSLDDTTWHWELRSVNSRGLDVRVRVPPGNDRIEQPARQALSAKFARGTISATLTVQRSSSGTEIRLHDQNLKQVLQAVDHLRALTNAGAPSIDALLNVKGVLEVVEQEEAEERTAARRDAILASLDTAMGQLIANRQAEGERLAVIVEEQLLEIEALHEDVARSPARAPAKIADRLREQIDRLISANSTLDADRLHQEAVLIATKIDVAEELDRLKAHVSAARDLLVADGPVGRKLDFLSQE